MQAEAVDSEQDAFRAAVGLLDGRVVILTGATGGIGTTIARMLGDALGWPLCEGDDLHSPANVEKMRHGIPLDDEDRRPWLEAIAAAAR